MVNDAISGSLATGGGGSSADLAVVCFFWGDRYGVDHVRRLRGQVALNLSLPHRFVVATNDPVVPKEMRVPLRSDLIPLGNAYPKLQVFSPFAEAMYGARRLIVLDLDVDIVGMIDHLALLPGPLHILSEFDYEPRGGKVRGRFNSSVMVLDAGAAPRLWTDFFAHPAEAVASVKRSRVIGSDQAWLSLRAPENVGRIDARHGVRSYRFDVRPNGRRPDDSIIVHHGKPKPWEI